MSTEQEQLAQDDSRFDLRCKRIDAPPGKAIRICRRTIVRNSLSTFWDCPIPSTRPPGLVPFKPKMFPPPGSWSHFN